MDHLQQGSVFDLDGKSQASQVVQSVYERDKQSHLYSWIYFDDEAVNAS